MIGFLFGIAVGTAIGFILGCVAAIGAKTGREADRVFKPVEGVDFINTKVAPIDRYRPELDDPKPDLTVKRAGVDHLYRKVGDRTAAGVRVCACIGDFRGPHYINPDCPFHGGAA
jgi:hypothetical protein